MLVLGINAFHADAAAALVRDGEVLAAVAEERLNRVKHYNGFPALAVAEVLRIAGAEWKDVDVVTVGRDGRANLGGKLAFVLKNLPRIGKLASQRLENRSRVASVKALLTEQFGTSPPRLVNVEHHLAHAASSFLVSPFERAAIMTIDGFGDFASTMFAQGEGESIKSFSRVLYPHSLGVFYTALCQFIGYDRYGDEGKIMGLAAYGDPARFRAQVEKLVRLPNDGFELNLDFFTHHTEGVDYGSDEQGRPTVAPLFSPRMAALFDGPALSRGAPLEQREMDIAAAMQERLERAYMHLLRRLHQLTGGESLCLAGGVALNSVANGKLLEETPFRRLYVHPAAGDDGTAVGAALWTARGAGDRAEMKSAALGDEWSDAAIRAALDKRTGEGFSWQSVARGELLEQTAEAVAAGLVTGWFQGRMEWGPRALGNRSIVAHPGHPRMKEILNARIKNREWFRPFAPSIHEDRLAEYFESSHPSPFMLTVYRTRPEKRAQLLAVDHEDHTGRVQTVNRDANPLYYDLIAAVERHTGAPVVLNTSFNENEPIVRTPDEAIDCFLRTKMDRLAIGGFFCGKAPVQTAP